MSTLARPIMSSGPSISGKFPCFFGGEDDSYVSPLAIRTFPRWSFVRFPAGHSYVSPLVIRAFPRCHVRLWPVRPGLIALLSVLLEHRICDARFRFPGSKLGGNACVPQIGQM